MENYIKLLSEPDASDHFDLIDKHLNRRNDVIYAIAIFDSILEHGFDDTIHSRMIHTFLNNLK